METLLERGVTTVLGRVGQPQAVPGTGTGPRSRLRWSGLINLGGAFALLGPGGSVLCACLILGLGASALCVGLCGQYLWWRYNYAMPVAQEPWQQIWAWMFFLVESLSILGSTTALLLMSCHMDLSSEFGKHVRSPMLRAAVRVLQGTLQRH
jgi:hypothetical protein